MPLFWTEFCFCIILCRVEYQAMIHFPEIYCMFFTSVTNKKLVSPCDVQEGCLSSWYRSINALCSLLSLLIMMSDWNSLKSWDNDITERYIKGEIQMQRHLQPILFVIHREKWNKGKDFILLIGNCLHVRSKFVFAMNCKWLQFLSVTFPALTFKVKQLHI